MNYQETINYLFSQLPMYQRNGTAAYKKNIGNIIKACKLVNKYVKTLTMLAFSLNLIFESKKPSSCQFMSRVSNRLIVFLQHFVGLLSWMYQMHRISLNF